MGDCYFHSIYWNYRGEILKKQIEHYEIRASETIGMLLKDDAKLQRCVNGTTGIFYYEFDLENIPELKRVLHVLVDKIGEKS